MDTSSTFAVFGDSATTMLSALVFLATGTLAFAVMLGIRAREAVRRRAARVNIDDDASGSGRRSLRYSGVRAAQKLVAYTTKHYSSVDSKDVKMLRARLVQAGVYNPHGTAYFFLARGAGALGLALAAFFVLPMFGIVTTMSFWLFVMVGGVLGYLAPSFYLDRRIKGKRLEHQSGFPDFMDLLVVCADAGLSMEAALDRVGRELGVSYPSLAANIHMANLEIRAGRTMTEALEHLGDRLGLEEARSFATLIQQKRCVARL
jgi:tight adherence protein C